MKYIIAILILIVIALSLFILIGLRSTKKMVSDNGLMIDTYLGSPDSVHYIQLSNPDDIKSFRLISEDGKELDIPAIAEIVRKYNATIGYNWARAINHANKDHDLDETSPSQNGEIKVWFGDKDKIEHFGFFLENGMRFRIRGIDLSVPEDSLLQKLITKLHIDPEKIELIHFPAWEK